MKTFTIKLFAKRMVLAAFFLLSAALLESCEFCVTGRGLCTVFLGSPPFSELTSSANNTVFEQPGTLVVYHGTGCAESNRSGTEVILRVEQSVTLPPYVTEATVFLNGWDLKYLDNDHHVAGLGVEIDSIRLDKNTLKWHVTGVLSDDNFDDGYGWCYHYTVIGWNNTNLNLKADHADSLCLTKDSSTANFYIAQNSETTTALSAYASFLRSRNFYNVKAASVLPRGFLFAWGKEFLNADCDDEYDAEDHHLFQIAYNLEHSEFFIGKGKEYRKELADPIYFPESVSQVNPGYVSWETQAIFKDGDTRRDYTFGERVSGLSGDDLGVIQPPFSIPPQEESDSWFSTCVGEGTKRTTREYVINNIPYEHAIPVLAGWDMDYGCSDEHVAEVGIWIDGFSYEKTPNASTGTLRYKLSSVLRDKGDASGTSRHKVNILGLKPTSAERLPGGMLQTGQTQQQSVQ